MKKLSLKGINFCKIKNDDERRTTLIKINIILSLLVKGWSGLVLLWLVPITLKCLGEYQNGVWLTLSSLLVWIDNLDIGLGNGLRNKLAATLAHKEIVKAREIVSSTFFILILIIVPIMLLICFILWNMDIYSFFNIDSNKICDLRVIMCVCVIFVCSTFIFKFIGNFYMGLQLPFANNLLVTCGQTITLILTYMAYITGHKSLFTIAVINTASPLVVYLLSYPYTFFYKYRELSPSYMFFKLDTARSLFTVGLKFFILQISGIILFFTSNIIISRLLSPTFVTPYQIVYRYFSIILLIFAILSTPFWSATTDAYEKGDIKWIVQSHKKMMRMTAILYVVIIFMVVVSPRIFSIWIGTEIHIPIKLTVMVAIYVGILIGSLSYSYFLNGIGTLFLQMIFTVGAALIFIPATSLAFSIVPSLYSIVFVMAAVNIPSLICNHVQFKKIIKKEAYGIWIK